MKLLLLILVSAISTFGQGYLLPNEELIFSFSTQKGKKVTLNKDKNNQYIIYRFGSDKKIELEFPSKTSSSWKSFSYSFYMRGGGSQNEGMDLNYLYFINNNYQYVIYDTYYSVGEKHSIGIKIIDLQRKKTTDIKGNIKTRKGTLIDFRDNKLIEITEELFD